MEVLIEKKIYGKTYERAVGYKPVAEIRAGKNFWGSCAQASKKLIGNAMILELLNGNYLFFCKNNLTDTYDALVIAGGMGEGHIPVGAIDEFLRVVRPGTEPWKFYFSYFNLAYLNL